MSNIFVISEHIEITPGVCGGKPRIARHRIRVQDIVIWHERMGLSPDGIVYHYPSITLADVYSTRCATKSKRPHPNPSPKKGYGVYTPPLSPPTPQFWGASGSKSPRIGGFRGPKEPETQNKRPMYTR
ncbi:MAG: DUF433 domain-containing protein [Leptolyngbyaceae bacterium]|nr:DUF433 domain-containing protein [Leptolyngbyaceae bacterium]